MTRVAVIGGGLAGLAGAIATADAGHRVELFERAPRLGGATWSFERNGHMIDNGQHVFMRCCTEYRAFLDRIGSADKVVLQPRMRVPVARPGAPLAILARSDLPSPLHLARSLLGFSPLPWKSRLSVGYTALRLRALDLDDPTLDHISFGEWLRANGADAAAIEALWDLVCLPTVNLRVDQASLALAAKVFKTGLLDTNDGADIGWAGVPLSELHADPAATVLEHAGATVHLRADVGRVMPHLDGGYDVEVGGEYRHFDAVIVAVPHDAVAKIVEPNTFDRQELAAELGRSPIINVHLLFDRTVLHEPFVAGLDSPVQFVFDRSDTAGVGAPRQFLSISLSAADDYLSWSSSRLIEHFTDAVRELLPDAVGANVESAIVTREVAATFRGVPGSASKRPPTATNLPGVALAGAWTDTAWPATMEGAVRSGNRAADHVVAYLNTVSSPLSTDTIEAPNEVTA